MLLIHVLMIVKVLSDSFLKLLGEKFPSPSRFDSPYKFASDHLHPTVLIPEFQQSLGDVRAYLLLWWLCFRFFEVDYCSEQCVFLEAILCNLNEQAFCIVCFMQKSMPAKLSDYVLPSEVNWNVLGSRARWVEEVCCAGEWWHNLATRRVILK